MEAIVIAANETQNICFQSLQKKMPGSKSLEEVARILKRKFPRQSRVSSQKKLALLHKVGKNSGGKKKRNLFT